MLARAEAEGNSGFREGPRETLGMEQRAVLWKKAGLGADHDEAV